MERTFGIDDESVSNLKIILDQIVLKKVLITPDILVIQSIKANKSYYVYVINDN